MRRILFRVLLAGVALAGLAYHGLHRMADALADPGNEFAYPAAAMERDQEHLILDGLLVPATVARVEAVLARGGVRMVRLSSAGGFVPSADALARRLNAGNIRLEVPRLCSSACVILLSRVRPELRLVHGGAWLRVHGSAAEPVDSPEASTDPDMVEAARALSPAWLAFLSACPSRPLARRDGIAMRWDEVRRVRADDDCRPIAHRTRDWLFGPG